MITEEYIEELPSTEENKELDILVLKSELEFLRQHYEELEPSIVKDAIKEELERKEQKFAELTKEE